MAKESKTITAVSQFLHFHNLTIWPFYIHNHLCDEERLTISKTKWLRKRTHTDRFLVNSFHNDLSILYTMASFVNFCSEIQKFTQESV